MSCFTAETIKRRSAQLAAMKAMGLEFAPCSPCGGKGWVYRDPPYCWSENCRLCEGRGEVAQPIPKPVPANVIAANSITTSKLQAGMITIDEARAELQGGFLTVDQLRALGMWDDAAQAPKPKVFFGV